MHFLPTGRRLYAALFVGLVAIVGASLAAGAASAQAPTPPGPPGTVVNLCTGGAFDQSLDEVATKLGVTRDELHRTIQTVQQGANAGALQQVNTGPSSGVCSAELGPTPPSSGTSAATRTPPGGAPSPGTGQVTCTGNGSGQPTCTGPGAGNIRCERGTGTDGRATVTCTSGQPAPGHGIGTCPPAHVEGDEGSGPIMVTGQESCSGATPASGGTTACASSASAGVGIVTSSGGSTVVRELTIQGYDAVAQQLGHGITGEQVRAAFCTVRR